MKNILRIMFVLVVLGMSVFVFFRMGHDKAQAIAGAQRVPEAQLLILTWAGGAPGTLVSMVSFWHKVRNMWFWVHAGAALLVWGIVGVAVFLPGKSKYSIGPYKKTQ